ncbi:MAG: hypothetical protein M3R08_01770, partial [Bacteroidota bacterium]|nr:hypothetical protein [Bacteroidota bacterium]
MRNKNFRIWINTLLICCLGFSALPGSAQTDVTAVELDVRNNTNGDSLQVYVRTTGPSTFEDLVSELSYTIRWPSSSPATIGPRAQFCSGGFNLAYYQNVSQNPGNGFKYATFNAFGLDFLSSACPERAWVPGQWMLVQRIKIDNNTGCTPFNIANDLYTGGTSGLPGGTALRNSYVELNGSEIPHTIDATPAYIGSPGGACAPDCMNQPGGTAVVGSTCNDGNANTANDVYGANCVCAGQVVDCAGVAGGTASVDQCGQCSGGTTGITPNSSCTDCAGVVNGTASVDACGVCSGGTTGNVVNATCADCTGSPNGPNVVGAPCDDGNSTTENDAYNTECICEGFPPQPIDCLGVPGGTAQPGTACDDGDPTTGSDTYDANCTCAGLLIDCEGVAGGPATAGTACNDGNTATGNDMWNAQCQCVGEPIDCLGVPGGTATVGTTCDDGNAGTTNDVYTESCTCAGTPLPQDCLGVPGGSATVG